MNIHDDNHALAVINARQAVIKAIEPFIEKLSLYLSHNVDLEEDEKVLVEAYDKLKTLETMTDK